MVFEKGVRPHSNNYHFSAKRGTFPNVLFMRYLNAGRLDSATSIARSVVKRTSYINVFCTMYRKVKRTLECSLCCKRFSSRSNLNTHSMLHSGVKPFSCDVCGRQFSQKGNLLRHSAVHSRKRRLFGCDVCGKHFLHKLHLVRHFSEHKRDSSTGRELPGTDAAKKEISLKCNVCGLQFMRIRNLITHLKVRHIQQSAERV